jgi:hypothetical protein
MAPPLTARICLNSPLSITSHPNVRMKLGIQKNKLTLQTLVAFGLGYEQRIWTYLPV